ncbi:hypothetical protein CHGG_00217 [Chaetomium globosum CBS 148.51]|uniref:Integrase catalytic domain-containing protein n=1 Tax=Chaetomium globosum (strain ATCC 6205 / CBS 148.51 / DSM 1962 / NBRC 6347 / NRRL 1970) TaxID=306901 RepID=Q2HHT7_CHAGB|nr:uncharacterized protein CHGG_00217 [Chaetomium globosum CBS 148.51]EAQ91982.1 hypothetical protein CHGG_00217 [Chaetomium globosum CBS 148.51]
MTTDQTKSQSRFVYLDGPGDWEVWEQDFLSKVKLQRVWDQVQGTKPLRKEPICPEPDQGYATRANAARGAQSATDSTITVASGSRPISVADLTDGGRTRFNEDMATYIRLETLYVQEAKAMAEIGEFVIKTVNPKYRRTCCKADDSISQWYINLKKEVGATTEWGYNKASNDYHEALKPLAKIKDYETFIDKWETAFSVANDKGVAETLNYLSWSRDFFRSIKNVPEAVAWGISYRQTKGQDFQEGKLTYRDFAVDFRNEMGLVAPTTMHKKIGRGAFGPTYADQEANDQNAEGASRGRGGRTRSGKKRTRDNRSFSSKCMLCDVPGHKIEECFFLSQQAPTWFSLDCSTERFFNKRPALPDDYIVAGDSRLAVRGYGDVTIQLGTTRKVMRLRDVAFIPSIQCNLVSLRLIRRQGFYWDNRNDPTLLRRRVDNSVVCRLRDLHGQYVIEYNDANSNHASFATRSARWTNWKRPSVTAEAQKWHLRYGHPGPEALARLQRTAQGVKIRGPTTVQCEACAKSKIKRQISRRPRQFTQGVGERLAVDFHEYTQGYEGFKHLMLVTDRWSGLVWDFYLTDRKGKTLVEAFDGLWIYLDTQYRIRPAVIETDNEVMKHDGIISWAAEKGIRFEPSAPYTQAQNGGAERSGGVIKEKARAIRESAKFPEFLWPEIVKAAVYLHNRTPTLINHWKSPYERFHTQIGTHAGGFAQARKPEGTHLKAYGCKAYAMTAKAQEKKDRIRRFNPKAWVGYLIGYQSSNIYRVWVPSLNRVISTRDVIFNEDEFFSGNVEQLRDDLRILNEEDLKKALDTAELPEPDLEDEPTGRSGEDEEVMDMGDPLDPVEDSSSESKLTSTRFEPLPTPPQSPPAAFFTTMYEKTSYDEPQDQESTYNAWQGVEAYNVSRQEGPRQATFPYNVKQVAAAYNASQVEVTYNDTQQATPWEQAYNAGRQTADPKSARGEAYQARRRRLRPMRSGYTDANKGTILERLKALQRTHRSELPVPPKNGRVQDHPLKELFHQAELDHLKSHDQMQSWREVPRTVAQGKQILGCMWVYVYKTDKHGYFVKCKARLVISSSSPCCFKKDGILVFFYVDDIVFAFRKEKRLLEKVLAAKLGQRYELSGGGGLQWFLGIEVIRDRTKRLIRLSQTAYIDKISKLIRGPAKSEVPMGRNELLPYDGVTTASDLNWYQRTIGSILFAAVQTRADISFATSRLARFLNNPGPQHCQAADQVLTYLKRTRNYALQLGGADTLDIASDASFADNSLDRKSSQGLAMKLFGGLIAWRANKQDTVTTSIHGGRTPFPFASSQGSTLHRQASQRADSRSRRQLPQEAMLHQPDDATAGPTAHPQPSGCASGRHVDLQHPLDLARLREACNKAVMDHSSLRTRLQTR